jgi:type I restriction enzyme R subunit
VVYVKDASRAVGVCTQLLSNDLRDAFAADFSTLARIWEALSPDPVLTQYETDYRWLAQVYESLKPSSGTGRLLWHRLGAKTIELIHENVHVDAVRDDLDTLVLDAELLEAVLGNPDPEKKAKEISVKLAGRLRKHAGNPKFKALGERLAGELLAAGADRILAVVRAQAAGA